METPMVTEGPPESEEEDEDDNESVDARGGRVW